MKKNLSHISLKGIFSNARFKCFVSIVIVVSILFVLSVNCFASQCYYGGFSFGGFESGGLGSVSKFIYRYFGRVQHNLIQDTGGYTGYFTMKYRSFGRTGDASQTNLQDFLSFIRNNSIALLLNYFNFGSYDYYTWDSLHVDNRVHWQMSFTASQPIKQVTITIGNTNYTASFTGNNSSVSWCYINNGVYIIDLDVNSVNTSSSVDYFFVQILTAGASEKVQSITFDTSLNPYWEKNGTSGDSDTQNVITNYNVYNIGNGTDLSGIYEYLNLITEWLDLLQETQGDTLDCLIDMYSDVMARLNSINSSLVAISGNVSQINGNVSSIFSMLAGINDRIQNIMSNIALIRSTLSDQYTLVDDIDYYMQNYMPLLQDIYDILEDIYSSVSGIEDQFLEWSNRQTIGSNHSNMKTYISSIFDYVKRFFSAVFDFTSGILSFNPFNALSNFDGGNMFAN